MYFETYFTRRSAIADCTACRLWNVKRASFLLGACAFRSKFYENRVIPCQNVDTVQKVVACVTILPLKVFRQWNFVADFWWFLAEMSTKTTYLGIWTPFRGNSGWRMSWFVGNPIIDFLFALIELLSLSITVPEVWGEMCTAPLFS